MSDLATTPVLETLPVTANLTVIAEQPHEISEANAALIKWCDVQIAGNAAEILELRAAVESAIAHKWKASTLQSQLRNAEKRAVYYSKLKAGLEAGYCIVPTMGDSDVIAIRTDADNPKSGTTISRWHPNNFDQKAKELPQGEGEYVDREPNVVNGYPHKDKDGNEVRTYWADAFKDVDLPLRFKKPRIMEVTSRAMELKLFDEIAVLPRSRAGDPMVVGRIINPRNKSRMSFLIAWFIDANDLR